MALPCIALDCMSMLLLLLLLLMMAMLFLNAIPTTRKNQAIIRLFEISSASTSFVTKASPMISAGVVVVVMEMMMIEMVLAVAAVSVTVVAAVRLLVVYIPQQQR
jgi:hypothetical protein